MSYVLFEQNPDVHEPHVLFEQDPDVAEPHFLFKNESGCLRALFL